ncbi:MAG: YdeI/OmpD-associated family protein [Gemella sp.]|nr:YdeI/OmpD-associated family protein [Gemella sp.]
MILENIKTREGFREWLKDNSKLEKECWLRVNRSKTQLDDVVLYLDAVEEALCFGWIDSTLKKFDDGPAFQRFTPRKKNSNWTELNKERVRRLEKLGLMTDEGRKVLPDMREASFEISKEILEELKKDDDVWGNFQKLPKLYIRVRISNIQSYQKRKEFDTARKQLDKFIENTKLGKIYGEWNDKGRLL